MDITKLWKGINVRDCETCKDEDCKGKLNYGDLCANVNYLEEYGEKNYEKNKTTFAELKKIMGEEKPAVFSFGCGVGLDYLGATESFGNNVIYYGIDECRWAIKDTANYRNFEPKLPRRTMKLDEGLALLSVTPKNAVVCFFNSLYAIMNSVDLKKKLIATLQNKANFYFVCDYTINSNFNMPMMERTFIDELLSELTHKFTFRKFDILSGRGIIVVGNRK